MKRFLLTAIGVTSVGLGMIGVFLPVLPTTPFLLLAAYCFARSSDRFHTWLITNRICGDYIRNYREGRGMTIPHKVIVLLVLWGTISYSAFVAVSLLWVRILLMIIAVSVTVHILIIRIYRPGCRQTLVIDNPRKTGSVPERDA